MAPPKEPTFRFEAPSPTAPEFWSAWSMAPLRSATRSNNGRPTAFERILGQEEPKSVWESWPGAVTERFAEHRRSGVLCQPRGGRGSDKLNLLITSFYFRCLQ